MNILRVVDRIIVPVKTCSNRVYAWRFLKEPTRVRFRFGKRFRTFVMDGTKEFIGMAITCVGRDSVSLSDKPNPLAESEYEFQYIKTFGSGKEVDTFIAARDYWRDREKYHILTPEVLGPVE